MCAYLTECCFHCIDKIQRRGVTAYPNIMLERFIDIFFGQLAQGDGFCLHFLLSLLTR